ncbi:MAG: L-serine ammonia-lyase [Candidatus Izemoplasmataceae bacterium]|jgi:L-serine dehydratase|uniref:L-serine ammonia-lyase n=1 Tax=Liberiplasma polymorphum TaxID=3374570 RepID=UPI003774125F
MKSIRELYKIGRGPSSSHTMGPEKACKLFKARYEADHYRVILYGSLSLTGKGHLTDKVIKETLENVDVIFSSEFIEEHPNTMDIIGYNGQTEVARSRVYSIGGGTIRFEGDIYEESPHVYPHQSFKEIKTYCENENIRLYEYVERFEDQDIYTFLAEIWEAMKASIENGLSQVGTLPGDLKVERKARHLYVNPMKNEPSEIYENRMVAAFAFAVNETNASGGTVVTAPTCGASGTVPAVLKYMQIRHKFKDKAVLRALATAGIIGNVIKHNASISGAEAGCQAEVGSACSMAAAAHADLFKLKLDQIEYAAEIALEHHLGLTCDPVLGYVQIPCIERNAVAALRAIDACGLAYFLSDSRKIDFDTVVETMFETGKDMPPNYRETSCGGLAKKYKFN